MFRWFQVEPDLDIRNVKLKARSPSLGAGKMEMDRQKWEKHGKKLNLNEAGTREQVV